MKIKKRVQNIVVQYKDAELALIQVVFIFVLPIVLLYFNIISKKYRIIILLAVCVAIYGIIKKEKWGKEDIGLKQGTFHLYFYKYIFITIVSLFGIIGYANLIGYTPQKLWWLNHHFWLIFILVSFLQEFAYRVFLITLLKRIFRNKYTVIVTNAFLFMLLHIIYPQLILFLPIAFLGGILFTYMYMKYPNLVLITCMHSILNFTAVLYGFFVLAQ